MIVLSVGMPRAGSGWHYNLIHDLMQTTNCAEARDIREKYHLQNILTEVNCNIGVLSLRRMSLVAIPALMGNTFVIKAHAAPSPSSAMKALVCCALPTYTAIRVMQCSRHLITVNVRCKRDVQMPFRT